MVTRALGFRIYMLMFGWPGTLVHELSHLLAGVLFLHKIDSFHINLFHPNAEKAGSVRLRHNPDSFYQKSGNFFIAIAPVFMCTAVIYLSQKILAPEILPISSLSSFTIIGFIKEIYATFFNLINQLINSQNINMWKGLLFAYILACVGSGIRLSKTDMKQALPGVVVVVVIFLTINIFRVTIQPDFQFPWDMSVGFIYIYAVMILALVLNMILAGLFYLIAGIRH